MSNNAKLSGNVVASATKSSNNAASVVVKPVIAKGTPSYNAPEPPARRVISQDSEKAKQILATKTPATAAEIEMARMKIEMAKLQAQVAKANADIDAKLRAENDNLKKSAKELGKTPTTPAPVKGGNKPAPKAPKLTPAEQKAKDKAAAAALKLKENEAKAKAKAKENEAKAKAKENEAKAKARAEAKAKKLAEKANKPAPFTRWDGVISAAKVLAGKNGTKTFTKEQLVVEADKIYVSKKDGAEANEKECKLYVNHFLGMLKGMELAGGFVPTINLISK